MSAKKLGRLAGFAFVLAVVFGGVGAASATTAHGTGDSSAVTTTAATAGKFSRLGDVIWL